MRAAWPPRALRCAAGRAEVSSCITSSPPRRVNPSPDHGERQRWPPAPAWTPTSPPPPRSSWEKAPWSGSRHGGWRPGWSTGRARSPALAPGQNQQVRSWPPTFSEQFPRKLDQSELVIKDGAARALVVDAQPNLTELVAMALRYEGFNVKTAATGRGALSAVSQFAPSLVILDGMLPDIDGIEVLKRLNSSGNKVPIIFLTAKDATEDKVHGLTIGGDDYVTKPFSIEELMARVRVVLRRHGSDSETGKLSLADLELDDEAHEVRRHGRVVELTNTEYRLLRYLLINAGRVLTPSQILDHVWHYDFGGDASVLETYISYLRRKVDRYDPPLVQTVRGVGYVLRTPRK